MSLRSALKWTLAVTVALPVVLLINAPPYADSTPMGQLAEGMGASNPHQTAVAIACSEGTLRAGLRNEDLGLRAPKMHDFQSTKSVTTEVGESGAAIVTILFKTIYTKYRFFSIEAIRAGTTLVYTGHCSDGIVTWAVSGTLPEEYLARFSRLAGPFPYSVALSTTREPETMLRRMAKASGLQDQGRQTECVPNLVGGNAATTSRIVDDVNGAEGPEMIVVPAGGDKCRPFAIGKYEVSNNEYNTYCASVDDCKPVGGKMDIPVTGISVQDARNYAKWLSEKTGLTYRLPTDAEWFHAANAQGLQPTNKDPNCRVKSNVSISSFPLPTTIGKRRANGWGLQNYLGNVREWTVGGGNTLYVRGGSFQEPIEYCDLRWRVADKGRPDRATGFRLVREMAEQ